MIGEEQKKLETDPTTSGRRQSIAGSPLRLDKKGSLLTPRKEAFMTQTIARRQSVPRESQRYMQLDPEEEVDLAQEQAE